MSTLNPFRGFKGTNQLAFAGQNDCFRSIKMIKKYDLLDFLLVI